MLGSTCSDWKQKAHKSYEKLFTVSEKFNKLLYIVTVMQNYLGPLYSNANTRLLQNMTSDITFKG